MPSANVTEYGDVSPRIGMVAAAKMLAHAQPVIVLSKMGQTRPMPKNKGQTIKFRRPVPFEPATTALTEGVTPSSQKMVYEDVQASLDQYGAWVEITDVIEDTHEDPVLNDASMLCGEQAADTIEALVYGVLRAGTAVGYANGSARNAVNTAISLNKQRMVTRALKAQRAKKLTSILDGSIKINTTPIEASYIAVGHTDLEPDIRELQGFVPVAEYGNRQPICPEEIGTVEDVRYVLSPMLDPWEDAGGAAGSMISSAGTNADVYPVMYFAKDAFGVVPLKGKESIKPMILQPNTPRGGDPLGQLGSVAWKTWHASLILNQAWMYRLEVAATDL